MRAFYLKKRSFLLLVVTELLLMCHLFSCNPGDKDSTKKNNANRNQIDTPTTNSNTSPTASGLIDSKLPVLSLTGKEFYDNYSTSKMLVHTAITTSGAFSLRIWSKSGGVWSNPKTLDVFDNSTVDLSGRETYITVLKVKDMATLKARIQAELQPTPATKSFILTFYPYIDTLHHDHLNYYLKVVKYAAASPWQFPYTTSQLDELKKISFTSNPIFEMFDPSPPAD